MPPESIPPFAVNWNGQGLDRVRRLSLRAREIGVGVEWAETLRRVEHRLREEPFTGDPQYLLRALGLVVHRSIIDRVEVMYAVHVTRPVVFVIRVTPRFGHPLEGVD